MNECYSSGYHNLFVTRLAQNQSPTDCDGTASNASRGLTESQLILSPAQDDPPPPCNADASSTSADSGAANPQKSVFQRFKEDHPLTATAAAVALIISAALAAPLVLIGAFNLMGFGARGIVAGSLASRIQSVCYGGAAASGSAFSIAQSIGTGGAAYAAVAPLVSVCVCVVSVAGARKLIPIPKQNDGAGSREFRRVARTLRRL
ncbi:hypothetical protein R3P38DRAFT_2902482, partial [Favolaschia claudopus]